MKLKCAHRTNNVAVILVVVVVDITIATVNVPSVIGIVLGTAPVCVALGCLGLN